MNAYEMFIDDERFPVEKSKAEIQKSYESKGYFAPMIIARSSREAILHMEVDGCPEFISFDHDLGGEDTAMNVVRYLIDRDLDMDGKFIPDNFTYYVHSQNCVGVRNINGLLAGYFEFKKGLKRNEYCKR